MNYTNIAVFSVIMILLAAIDFYYGYKAFQKAEEIGRYLGLASMAAGFVTLSYLLSIRAATYTQSSFMSSLYFAGIDWMLIALLHFIYRFTGLIDRKGTKAVCRAAFVYAVFDTFVMIVNVFREIAVHYVPRSNSIAPYSYEMKPLYYAHLIFTYALVLLILGILTVKCLHTPRQYRNQYSLNILAIVFVVAINAVFLYLDDSNILSTVDASIVGYSLGVYLMYWAAFEYRHNDMLKSLSMTIFENIDQGLVLFDYNQELIMQNRRAERLLSWVRFSEKMDWQPFLDACGISEDSLRADQFSLQCDTGAQSGPPLRCDYRRLRDANDGIIGNLFVLTDISNNTDLLTGFQHWDDFRRFAAENPYIFDHPTTVVVFDLAGLSEINQTFGREVGNQRLRNLSRIMRKILPEDTYYVRGFEAHLVAICRGKREEDLRGMVDQVVEANAGSVLFGMCTTADRTQGSAHELEPSESRNIITTIDVAFRSLQNKKLLDVHSHHSQTLSSLIRALMESDSDTEAHVQRTQKMGIELGRRIGLTDAQFSELQLLCLLHDVGKIGIPLEILNKPGKLTEQEWAVLRTHTEKGYQIAMSSDELKSIAKKILYHHERWDGKGYPEKLSGNSIPLLSRIISIIDAYDAMVNDRAYRKALSPEEAQAEIRRCAGTQFDPEIAEEFLKMLEEQPDIAVGEQTGAEEIRFFIPRPEDVQNTGKAIPIHYSRYRLDMDDTIIEVDDAFEELTGYSSSDAVGKMNQLDLIPMDDRAYYMMQVNNQFSHENLAFLEHELQRKDGSKIWVICFGKRYFDSAEKAFRSEILVFRSKSPKAGFAPAENG